MKCNIIEYSSNLFPELYHILHEVYGSEINIINLEKNYLGQYKKIYLALLDDTVVGCAFFEIKKDFIRPYKYGFISYVAVDQKYRKHGVGRKIIEHLIFFAKQNKCKAVELTSADYRTNAHSFYKSLGFSKKRTTIFIKEPL